MKIFATYITLIVCTFFAACDVQSGVTKKSVEKYTTTPTPETKATVAEPIDPADVITVDTAAEGPQLFVNKPDEKKVVNCDKYNRVSVNGDGREVTLKGVCKQLMVNGDNARITAVALTEIVVNGHENNIQYSKYANGAKPVIKDSGSGNTILKADPPDVK